MPKYEIPCAMDVRAYGYIEVEGDLLKEAIEKVDADYVRRHFEPNGAGMDDFDFDSGSNITLMPDPDDDPSYDGSDYIDISADENCIFIVAVRNGDNEVDADCFTSLKSAEMWVEARLGRHVTELRCPGDYVIREQTR